MQLKNNEMHYQDAHSLSSEIAIKLLIETPKRDDPQKAAIREGQFLSYFLIRSGRNTQQNLRGGGFFRFSLQCVPILKQMCLSKSYGKS